MNKRIFHIVARCFDDHHWKYLWIEVGAQTRLFAWARMSHGDVLCVTSIREEIKEVVFSSFYEFKVPAGKQQEVAAFLTRANDALTGGHFELDRQNGEIGFSSRCDGGGQPLTASTIRQFIWISLSTADRSLPALKAMIAGDIPSNQASPLRERVGV